jgi:nicotinate dehydrogenase subunit B
MSEFRDSGPKGMGRRDFVKLLGGGILVSVNLGPLTLFNSREARDDQSRGYPEDINAYLHIAEDGQVTLYSGKIEMGQGIMTSLSQMAAEDLGVSLESMSIVMGDTDTCPWDMGTFGSLTTRMFGPAVRAAAARARLALTDMAADRLGVSREALSAENGVVYVTGDRRRNVSYGALAQGRAITHRVGAEAVLRRLSGSSPSWESLPSGWTAYREGDGSSRVRRRRPASRTCCTEGSSGRRLTMRL